MSNSLHTQLEPYPNFRTTSGQQHGAVVARGAHNPEVIRSNRVAAIQIPYLFRHIKDRAHIQSASFVLRIFYIVSYGRAGSSIRGTFIVT